MRLPSLDGLAQPRIPAGMAVGIAGLADDAALAALLAPGFPDTGWTATKVREELLEHPLVTHTHVIRADSRIVATASCKDMTERPETGYVHYVAADPAFAGQGLGAAVTLLVLHEFRRQGKREAILDTDDFRLAALATYFKLGFEPLTVEEGQDERWAAVRTAIRASPSRP